MAKNPLIRKFPKKVNKPLPNKSAGIFDDYAVRKVVATKEGSITKVPTADIDIANKFYVDSNDFWQRVGDVLSPKTAGDDIQIGTGKYIIRDGGQIFESGGQVQFEFASALNFQNTNPFGSDYFMSVDGFFGTSTPNLGSITNKWQHLWLSGDVNIAGTIDLGTNTIADGQMVGDWDFSSGNLTTTGKVTANDVDVTDDLTVGSWMTADTGEEQLIVKDLLVDSGVATAAKTGFNVTPTGDAEDGRLVMEKYATVGNIEHFFNANGTKASPDHKNDGDFIWVKAFGSWSTGTTWGNPAWIQLLADGNHGVGSTPAKFLFQTCPSGSTSQRTVAKMLADGSCEFGVGSNYTQIEADGTIHLNGTATVWEDLRVPVSSVSRLGFSDPDWVNFIDGVYALAFDGGVTEEEVFFTVQMPHSWKEGTTITPHIHWSPGDIGCEGEVVWNLEYTWANIDSVFGETSTAQATDATGSTNLKHLFVDMDTIDGSGKTISSILMCRLYRDPTLGGDTYEEDALLLEIDFHYESDTIGSRQILTK